MILLSSFTLAMLISPAAASHTYKMTIGGGSVGESQFSQSADGSITSTTTFKVGQVKVKEDLSAKFDGSKPVSFTFKMSGTAANLDETWDGKQLTIVQSGETKKYPLAAADMPPAWMSNYMPGMMNTIPADLWKDGKTKKTVKFYLVEGANIMDAEISRAGTKECTINGQKVTAEKDELDVAAVKMELFFGPNHQFLGWNVPAQKYQAVEDGVTGLFEDPMAKYPELSQAAFKAKVVKNLVCKTQDGTKLLADAVIPDQPGKYPVILVRTPYGRGNSLSDGYFYAERGYAFVVQDVRGRGDSDGKFDPFVHEGRDGYDAIQWASKLPFANGKVGTYGASYLGGDQWEAAVLQPPALKCMIPQVAPPGPMENIPYEYGTFTLLPNLWWTRAVAGKTLDIKAMTAGIANPKGLLQMPLTKVPEAAMKFKDPIFTSWLARNRASQYGDWNYEPRLLNAKVPALQISGWWDGDGIGTDLNWLRLRAAGRTNQWLIEGPWPHEFNTSSKIGTHDFGPNAVIDLQVVYLRWFDHWLKGKDAGFSSIPKVQYFVMGENQWHKTSDFPDPHAVRKTLYLSAHGRLSPSKGTGADSYTENPNSSQANSIKGLNRNLMEPVGDPFATKRLPAGKSVSYFTPLQESDQIIEGPYGLDLYLKINRPSADLFALIVDVDPAGKLTIASIPGKLNLSYMSGLEKPKNLIPGKVYKAHLFPWMSAYTLKRHHKLGIMIFSNTFPGAARNPNTGESLLTAKKMVPVKVTILHDSSHPSSFSYYSMPAGMQQ